MTRKTLLVLDDSEICRQVAKVALEARGHTVHTADSPFGFAQLVRETAPHLVLVDVNMPSLSGDKVVMILRKHLQAPCPVVLLSDRPESELAALAAASGASGFIRKTADLVLLADEVERYLK